MEKKDQILSVFFHNYYGEDYKWISFLLKEIAVPFNLFYTYVSNSHPRLNQESSLDIFFKKRPANLKRLVVRSTTNKGKDIGGKLVLMDAYLKLGIRSDYLLLLHDKHSPYHSNSMQWQKELFRIVEKQISEAVFAAFCNDPQIGIVASQKAIRHESDNDERRDAYTSSAFINTLRSRYGINTSSLKYVAGTMFWVRAPLFEEFFSIHNPLDIRRELEEGNVLDADQPTHTHSWERLLCWLVTSKGYKIKGV